MNWSELIFFAPVVVVVALTIWAAARRKWPAIAPVFVLGLAAVDNAWKIQDYVSRAIDALLNSQPHHLAMTWLMASVATLVCWIAIWAGYSRGQWFWRLAAIAGVLALLGLIEANEPILLFLATTPLIAGGAYLLRRYQARHQPRENELHYDQTGVARFRWSLRDAFLVFVVMGLVGVALRPVAGGGLYLVGLDFAVTCATLTAISWAAAGSGLAGKTIARFAFGLATIAVLFVAVNLHRSRDGLGVAYCFHEFRSNSCTVQLVIGATAMTGTLVLMCNLYTAATRTHRASVKWIAGSLLGVVLTALLTPLALVYPRMAPPTARIAPPPPSATYAKIQAAGQKAESQGALRFRAIVNETAAALAEPGNVWLDAHQLREKELSLTFDTSFNRDLSLCRLLEGEIIKAEAADRVSKSLELAVLEWRLARVLGRGGIYINWAIGYTAEGAGCAAVSGAVEKLSDNECRQAMIELQKSLADRPDVETVLAYHDYWNRTCFGWRTELYRSALWLIGEAPTSVIPPPNHEEVEEMDRRGLLRLRLLQTRLALELYRRQQGRWPERLSDLTPAHLSAVPADPYANGPLVYRRHEDGFLLYSVGPDRRDDGGRFCRDPEGQGMEGFDIDWEHERRVQAASQPGMSLLSI